MPAKVLAAVAPAVDRGSPFSPDLNTSPSLGVGRSVGHNPIDRIKTSGSTVFDC